ncbi:MAG: hypothetical protein JNM19_17580, partial [Chitinophagaceae bacterium]|nr:hypothetical protein [Chitinophagaceae bacterium]
MKTVFVVAIMLTCSVSFCQPADNSKVKPFVDKFWQYMDEIKKIEAGSVKPDRGTMNKNTEVKSELPVGADNNVTKLKIIADNAKRQIEHVKKRDPNYDVSKMEALIQPYFDAKQAAVDTHNARILAASWHNSDEGCYGLFQKNTTTEFISTGNLEEDIKKHIAQLEDYNKRLENILKNRMAGVETCHDYIKSRTDAGNERVTEYFMKLDKTDDAIVIKDIYRELLGEEAYWNAAKQLYPDITAAAGLHSTIQKKLQSLGGLEGILAKAKIK